VGNQNRTVETKEQNRGSDNYPNAKQSKMCLSAKPYNSNFWRTNTSKYILRPRLPKYILQLIHAEDQHRDQEYKQQIDPEREIDRKPNDLTDSDSQPAWFGLNLQTPKGG